MKIIIAGGGKVGKTLLRQLAAEGHELTLIDRNSRLDILLKDGWKLEISNPVRLIPANNQ